MPGPEVTSLQPAVHFILCREIKNVYASRTQAGTVLPACLRKNFPCLRTCVIRYRNNLNSHFTCFPGADAHGISHGVNKNLAVAYLSGSGCLGN